MRTINICFVDFWTKFNVVDNFIYKILSKRYNVVISQDPKYLFYSDYGFDHIKFDCVKIFFTGENTVPDFNFCDYAIGPHFIKFPDRYIRVPLSGIRKEYKKVLNKECNNNSLLNRKFCNFVYSNINSADPFRMVFFEKLSEYKKVDSGGLIHNNIGGLVRDKISFLSQYKFTVSFENSSVEGYTSEKILAPMLVNSIPIYWGNPKVEIDFNEESFINIKDKSFDSLNKAIEAIKFLDENDEEYLKMLSKPWIRPEQYINYEKKVSDFLYFIIDQPYRLSKRRGDFGRNMVHKNNMLKLLKDNQNDNSKVEMNLKVRLKKALKIMLNKV